jgi:pantothenate kinase type III
MADSARLLTADCGNSTIDVLRHADGARARLAADDAAAALPAFVRGAPVVRCVAVSVAPRALATLRAALVALGVPLELAGEQLRCPLRLDYDTPHTLGADRWVGALAAWRLHGRAIVVDCGSATTVNLVDADGTFRGGAIAPGLRALAAGMAAVTPALPPPALDAAPSIPPRSTQAAVDTGVMLGWCGLVERLVARTLRASRGPATVVLTGGNAERLVRHGRLHGARLVPDLVHQGLRMLAGEQP